MPLKEFMEKVYQKEDMTLEESKEALFAMMSSECSPAQISGFLTAIHMKGETANEVTGFALAMREKAVPVPIDNLSAMDTCGTGGDRRGSFNISTLTAVVLAGCGIPVVKHGNYAASSSCGSADLLEGLGMRYHLSPEEAAEALDRTNFAFLFAPDYHPAAKSILAIAKQLSVPTIFYLLGPLTNPAHPKVQLIGVYDFHALPLIAGALAVLDPSARAVFLHSTDGFDEATPCCNFLFHSTEGEVKMLSASQFGFKTCVSKDLRGGTSQQNAAIAMSILNGELGPRRETV